MVTYADLTAMSKGYPTQTIAQRALVRMQATTSPMPPAPASPATAGEIATLQTWVSAGTPTGSWAPPDAGAGTDGGAGNPYDTPTVCSSMTTWTSGNQGSASMNPGQACIACHSKSDGPTFGIAGTVYPTAHEPNNCNGSPGSSTAGATIVVVDANNKTITVPVNSVGNFSYGTVAKPYRAKVVFGGKERVMSAAQTNGDCNGCHTETGASSAPGRIMLP
jgi:hypothetical protein